VDSTVGSGSVFWFDLNAAPTPNYPVETIRPADAGQASVQHDERSRTLLYVEDNPANLRLVEQLIARRLYLRLLSAKDSNLGIQLARQHHPDLILMDINLPGISGVEALHLLREDPATRDIPVIAVSANAMPRDVQRGVAAGFFRYLTKPIDVKEFMKTLDEALELVAGAAGLVS